MSLPSPESLQAAAYLMRLKSAGRTPAVAAAVREWLEADPKNRAAFDAATQMWESAGTLPVSLSARVGRPAPAIKPGSAWKLISACGALACLCLAGGLVYMQHASIVRTTTGQQLVLPLEDGSRVTLNTDTRLKVRFDTNVRRVVLESGEALFEVALDSKRRFVVQAGAREVTALGTQFVVRYDAGQTAVTLMEGKVSVGAGTLLRPGERLTFDDRNTATVDRPAIDKVTAWKRGQVAFENTPLAAAVEEMNRYSTHKLVLGTPEVGGVLVSGLFRTGDSDNFALALANTHPVKVVEREGATVIVGAGR